MVLHYRDGLGEGRKELVSGRYERSRSRSAKSEMRTRSSLSQWVSAREMTRDGHRPFAIAQGLASEGHTLVGRGSRPEVSTPFPRCSTPWIGIVKMNLLPWPGVLSAQIRPR